MKKRRFAVILMGMFAVLAMAGCGVSRNEKKLVIWTNMSVEAETLKTYADRWGQENGYEVEVIHQSPSV